MIIVTGGAGFIGSALIWKLNQMGETDILVVDCLGQDDKGKNLRGLKYADYLEKDEFLTKVFAGSFNDAFVQAIFHMGACSSTTEQDATYLVRNNYEYTRDLAEFALGREIRFIYASSAATYGNGKQGYRDDHEGLEKLKPLNMYGHSKQMMDLWALRKNVLDKIVGLKYFNVFGPNEYHKEDMRSMVHKGYGQIQENGKVRLFKSYHPDFKDGEQVRDFLYVKDAVDMTVFFMEHPEASGIFNVGSGKATTWKAMMTHLFDALQKPVNIEIIDMPEPLRDRYQYHTQADMEKMRKAGYDRPAMSMKDAIADYAEYLTKNAHLGDL